MSGLTYNRTSLPPKYNIPTSNRSDELSFFVDTTNNPNDITEPVDVSQFKGYDLSNAGTVTVESEYGTMQVTLISVEEEVRRVEVAMNKKHTVYKYYSLIGVLSAISLAVFITLGATGAVGPATLVTGVLMSSVGVLGSYLDWKDWLKKNAY